MRKFIAMLLAGMLLFCCAGAAAEETQKAPDFILEGFDGDSSNHVWDTNLFFARMQEKTGISFQFRQYSDYDQWTERKKALLEGSQALSRGICAGSVAAAEQPGGLDAGRDAGGWQHSRAAEFQ